MKIEFDSKLVYGDNGKYIKTKIKIYGSSVSTNFQGKKIPKEKVPHKSLSIIMLDSRFLTLFEEGKYEPKIIKMENYVDDELEKSSSDESDNDSNDETESDDEKGNDEFNE